MKGLVLTFVLGLILGVLAAIFLPAWVGPYLPRFMQSEGMAEAEVVAKGWEEERLLVTLRTEEGATLVTFNDKAAEIDLLVQPGDLVTLDLEEYRPFVDDPEIARVRQPQKLPAPAALPSSAVEGTAAQQEDGESTSPGVAEELPESAEEPPAEEMGSEDEIEAGSEDEGSEAGGS